MLPDIPKNMPNMKILIREFETGFRSVSANCRDIISKSSTSSDGNFVKKIVEAYESGVRAFNETSQRERERSDFFNTLDVTRNRKNVEKSGSSLAICDAPSSQCRNNLDKKSKIFLSSFVAREVEDDFIILNRYPPESDKETVSEKWPGLSSRINMYSSMNDLLNVQSSPSKRSETWHLKKRDKKLADKSMKNKLMICSSPLEDAEDKDLDCEDPLDDVLTSSCDSSSDNSYRNLQAGLYNFKDERWQPGLSSTSLSSLKSPSGSGSYANISINSGDCNLRLDSSFQDVTVTSSKDIPKNRETRDSKVPSPSNFNRKSPLAIGASLNEDRPIKIDSDTCIPWISAMGEKLSRKGPLKLLKSTLNTKLLNYKKVWKKSAEKQPNERTSDSGFIKRFQSSSSSFSQKSDPEKPPTFGTFGRAKSASDSGKILSKSSRMVLTEVPREKFTSDSEPSDSTSYVSSHRATTSCKENHQNVESSLKSTILASPSKLKASCGYPPHLKHPYSIRNEISKYPFVSKTKGLDRTMEKESVEKEEKMRRDAKERESDTRELESSGMSPVSEADLSSSYSRMSEWLTLSLNSSCNLSRSRPYKSTSALDGLVPQQTPVHNVPMLCNFSTDLLLAIHDNVPDTRRYATVSPKNLRFSVSREKLRAIESNLDV